MADVPAPAIALRFQRAVLRDKADLSATGLAALSQATHPAQFVDMLAEGGNARDALHALALMLPHRQAVWWACLAARLLPALASMPNDLAAVEAAERWVQSASDSDAQEAGAAAQRADLDRAPAWAAMAAFWAGPSLAPRGQQAVTPLPHLPGVALRSALILLTHDPVLQGRVALEDWLTIGRALMSGGNGRDAQALLRERIAAS